ncbi:hypothetical protein [Nonomuraea turcica]|uniref:hypothetical protein n=1 Tax=Nonomuraea sp. G32 TaxID=3067274 RepID=UPI00273B0B89|nr:hypothetical protein [Nonomuraea sp. G32]MDP4503704.1 hypothetical protein [Nonomuraea sp. G32]
MLAAGADHTDLVRIARSVAYETAFALLYSITAHGYDHGAPDTPGWRLMETTPAGELTGRSLQALHEDLLSMDPSGQEGGDLSE